MTSMSKSLPSSGGQRMKSERSDRFSGLHSSQSYSGRSSVMTYKHKQYPSASAALNAYISDYENQLSQSAPVYRRTVSDLLLPPTTLRRTAERSLDTGVRDTKNEFHRFSIKKLIDDSYEHLLKEDRELGHAYSSSAHEESVAYPKTNSSATFHDESASERQFSDVISEISSSTDALLLANPYALPRQNKDRKCLHAKNVRQVTSTPIDSSLHNGRLDRSENPARCMASSRVPRKNPTRHSLSSTVPRENSTRLGVSSRVPREKSARHSLSATLPRREPARSLSGGSRQQVPSRGHSSLQHPSHLKVSSRRHPSQKMEAAGIKRKLATSGSNKDGRLVPTWVTELDSSEDSRSNLATLYVDTLLSEDGHPPTPETYLRRQLDGQSSMNSSEQQGTLANYQSFINPEEERALSVMSGTRPPPTWVEDLDITTGTLPVSLRLLARDVDLDASKNSSNFHYEPTQRSSRSGLSDAQANGLSKPASLHSDIQKRTQHPVQLPESQGEVISKKYHFRTHSTDTEELINESPFGDGASKVMSVQLSHYNRGQKHFIRSKGASDSGFKRTEAVGKERKQLPVTASIQNERSLSRASHRQPKAQVHVHQPQRLSNGVLGHAATDRILDASTTTDSLIYSSPFGLDRNLAQSDALGIPRDVGLSGSLSPIGSQGSDSTMKEEELASLSTFSSLTVENVLTERGEGGPGPLIGDHVSETTVGETARANAVIRRANIVVENTNASLNVSSLLQQRNNSLYSNTTEELLAGDQDIMAKLRAEMGSRDDAPQDPAVQKRMDQFLADCLNSSNQESPEVSEDQVSEGPLESLKNMLFKLQDMASQRTLGTEVQMENGPPKRYSVSSHGAKNAGDKLVIKESGTKHRTSLPGQPPHSPLPQAATAMPLATSAPQQATLAQPLATSAQPLATLAKPPAASALPHATSEVSPATSSQPRATSALPQATPARPSASSTSRHLEDASGSFQNEAGFDEEPGGRSLQRAMQHLSRLKILVAMDTNVS